MYYEYDVILYGDIKNARLSFVHGHRLPLNFEWLPSHFKNMLIEMNKIRVTFTCTVTQISFRQNLLEIK